MRKHRIVKKDHGIDVTGVEVDYYSDEDESDKKRYVNVSVHSCNDL